MSSFSGKNVYGGEDIHNGHGIGMLAPEQELLTEEILPYIPEERIDDVVYFDPANSANPIPLNQEIPRSLLRGYLVKGRV